METFFGAVVTTSKVQAGSDRVYGIFCPANLNESVMPQEYEPKKTGIHSFRVVVLVRGEHAI